MVKYYLKKIFTVLAIRERKIKTTLKFQLTPLEWQWSTEQSTSPREDVGERKPSLAIGGTAH